MAQQRLVVDQDCQACGLRFWSSRPSRFCSRWCRDWRRRENRFYRRAHRVGVRIAEGFAMMGGDAVAVERRQRNGAELAFAMMEGG